MDNRENLSRWVESRLATLGPSSEWRPDAMRALSRLKARKVRRFRFLWASAVAAAMVCLCFALLVAQPACASPVCALLAAAHPDKTPAAEKNFKEEGSPTARVTVEIYSDYECPMCASLARDVVPQLVSEYVRTGKIKLLHRDYPLPQHPYARLAARYANAAGKTGYYDIVAAQIFKTQDFWNKNGDIDTQVAQVLPPGLLQKVRQMVKNDATLDDSVVGDIAMAQKDGIGGTPTLVIVANGKRQSLPSAPSFTILRAYLDQLLAH